jgi:hypothetical protein
MSKNALHVTADHANDADEAELLCLKAAYFELVIFGYPNKKV